VLIQTLDVAEPKGLEFVERYLLGLDLSEGNALRFVDPVRFVPAAESMFSWSRHYALLIMCICTLYKLYLSGIPVKWKNWLVEAENTVK
jgi:hypothetical protein